LFRWEKAIDSFLLLHFPFLAKQLFIPFIRTLRLSLNQLPATVEGCEHFPLFMVGRVAAQYVRISTSAIGMEYLLDYVHVAFVERVFVPVLPG
jgi:hypothetical protein